MLNLLEGIIGLFNFFVKKVINFGNILSDFLRFSSHSYYIPDFLLIFCFEGSFLLGFVLKGHIEVLFINPLWIFFGLLALVSFFRAIIVAMDVYIIMLKAVLAIVILSTNTTAGVILAIISIIFDSFLLKLILIRYENHKYSEEIQKAIYRSIETSKLILIVGSVIFIISMIIIAIQENGISLQDFILVILMYLFSSISIFKMCIFVDVGITVVEKSTKILQRLKKVLILLGISGLGFLLGQLVSLFFPLTINNF